MTTGTGLALLGIWGFASSCVLGPNVTGTGMAFGIVAALIATGFLAFLVR